MSKSKLGLAALLASGLLAYGIACMTDTGSSPSNTNPQDAENPMITTKLPKTRSAILTAAQAAPTAKAAAFQVRWQIETDGSGVSAEKQLVSNGIVYYSANNNLYARNITTGKLLWSYKNAAEPQFVTNNSVFVFANSDHLLKISATTGKLIWKIKVAQFPMEVGGHAQLINGKVIFANERGGIIAYNPVSGKKLWENPEIPMYAGTIYGEYKGVLLVSSTVNNIRSQYYGLDPATGKQLWRNEGIYYFVTIKDGKILLREQAEELYEPVTAPVPGYLMNLVTLDPATGNINSRESYQPLDNISRMGSFSTSIQNPYIYTVDGYVDQFGMSLTRFTRGQHDPKSIKSYDTYGSCIAGPAEGMAFFQQGTVLTGVHVADDRALTFDTPPSKVNRVQKKDDFVYASFEDGSFSVMSADTGASLFKFDTGLSYTYFGNVTVDNGTALIRFESKLFAVALPK